MEKCIFKNKTVYANNVTKHFIDEKLIREAGGKNQLLCYGCGQPVTYNRGEIRKAYFSHKKDHEKCDYDKYSKLCQNRSEGWHKIKEMLYQHFVHRYPNAEIEKSDKLIPNHWTDISITLGTDKKYAIEIADKRISSKKLTDICTVYKNNSIIFDWIVLDKVTDLQTDMDAYYIKRARLNESANNTLIVVDIDDLSLAMYKMDINKYIYTHTTIEHSFEGNIFCYKTTVGNLILKDDSLSTEGFDEKYADWLNCRKSEFEAENGIRQERSLRRREKSKNNNTSVKSGVLQNNHFKNPSRLNPRYHGRVYTEWSEVDFRNIVVSIAKGQSSYLLKQVEGRLKQAGSSEFFAFISLYEKAKEAVKEKPYAQQYVDVFEQILINIGRDSYLIR
ncbi:hypothetical protein JCM14036_14790 [Desulfotomaculum defluvii]